MKIAQKLHLRLSGQVAVKLPPPVIPKRVMLDRAGSNHVDLQSRNHATNGTFPSEQKESLGAECMSIFCKLTWHEKNEAHSIRVGFINLTVMTSKVNRPLTYKTNV
jgi:hypothetical protein